MSSSKDILLELIKCPSITPNDAGTFDIIKKILTKLDFEVTILTFGPKGKEVKNLYARREGLSPEISFCGHVDVVPPGDEKDWISPPFSPMVKDGYIYGRGASDMKSGIACYLSALNHYLNNTKNKVNSLSLLITSDEEGPSIYGIQKLMKWISEHKKLPDHCIVGEPTSISTTGDAIKIGRRGSLSGNIIIIGKQGHVAYPDLASNPCISLGKVINKLSGIILDAGNSKFAPSNLEIIGVSTTTNTFNLIPGSASLSFNIRFNNNWTSATLKKYIKSIMSELESKLEHRLEIEITEQPAEPFLVDSDELIKIAKTTIYDITKQHPNLNTGGGTSDARFIIDYCPVIELGLYGPTLHQVNEKVSEKDLTILTDIYLKFLNNYFNYFIKQDKNK